MSYKRLPDDLGAKLRAYGLKVVVVPGYKTRGRPASIGSFDPKGVLCHHTATSKASSDASVVSLLIHGRSDLPGPLCQIGLARDGTVYLIASGRANHAGEAKASGPMPEGDGNTLYIGIEAFNDGVGEPWPEAQYSSYALLCAALLREITHGGPASVRGHKETSVTGKVDPRFDMDNFRQRVGVMAKELDKPKSTRGPAIDGAIKDLRNAKGTGTRMEHIKSALASLKLIKPLK